jgi:lysophospholipase L1-like esterase
MKMHCLMSGWSLGRLLPGLAAIAVNFAVAHAIRAAEPAVQPIAAFASGARILFQGDSITDGNRGRGADPNHILGHGYVFIIAARHGAAFPGLKLDFMNRGVSGNTVTNLQQRWQKDTLDLQPDLLSILVGVNDSGRGVPLDQYAQLYERLLADTKAANPNIKLVLCEPFLLPVGKKKDNYETSRADIHKRQDIVARLAKKYGAALVKFQSAFDEACQRAPAEHWIWDGVHPTYSGHQIMADAWERTVRAFWPKAP